MELDVRRFETAARAEKPASLGDVGSERPPSFATQAFGVVRRSRRKQALCVGMPAHQEAGVILEALANRQIDTGRSYAGNWVTE